MSPDCIIIEPKHNYVDIEKKGGGGGGMEWPIS